MIDESKLSVNQRRALRLCSEWLRGIALEARRIQAGAYDEARQSAALLQIARCADFLSKTVFYSADEFLEALRVFEKQHNTEA